MPTRWLRRRPSCAFAFRFGFEGPRQPKAKARFKLVAGLGLFWVRGLGCLRVSSSFRVLGSWTSGLNTGRLDGRVSPVFKAPYEHFRLVGHWSLNPTPYKPYSHFSLPFCCFGRAVLTLKEPGIGQRLAIRAPAGFELCVRVCILEHRECVEV